MRNIYTVRGFIKMIHYTTLQLVNMGTFIPAEIRESVLEEFGLFTMNDFDKYFSLNNSIGRPYDNCYASIMSLKGSARRYHSCLDRDLKTMFNIVHSAIHSPLGKKVWF